MKVTITLTDERWEADLVDASPFWGRYSGSREEVHGWLTHPTARHQRWADVIEGDDREELTARAFQELPPMVQAIMVADVSGADTLDRALARNPEGWGRI